MNKIVIALAVVAVLVGALAAVAPVFAQTPGPQAPAQPGYGMMGAGRGMGGRWQAQGQAFARGEGYLHDEMMAAFAGKLGLTVTDLEKRIEAGETLANIASSKGMTVDQFRALWSEARGEALALAVKNGKITQAQADWMKTRGMGAGRGMMRGLNGDCPYNTTTTQ